MDAGAAKLIGLKVGDLALGLEEFGRERVAQTFHLGLVGLGPAGGLGQFVREAAQVERAGAGGGGEAPGGGGGDGGQRSLGGGGGKEPLGRFRVENGGIGQRVEGYGKGARVGSAASTAARSAGVTLLR